MTDSPRDTGPQGPAPTGPATPPAREPAFNIPKNLKWYFLAGVGAALFLAQYLSSQKNPFPEMVPAGSRVVAVFPFEGPGEPVAAGDTLRSRIVAALAGRKALRVISPGAVDSSLRAQGHSGQGHIAPSLALKVASAIGATRFVVGSYSILAGRMETDAKVVDPRSGHFLGTAHRNEPVNRPDSLCVDLLRVLDPLDIQ